MRGLIVAVIMVLFCAAAWAAAPVTYASAQDAADVLAASGRFEHLGCRVAEGIGFSKSSPDDAVRRCCFWGKRTPVDIGVAWSPARRGWIAVVRYR